MSKDLLLVEDRGWRFLRTVGRDGESVLVVEHVDQTGNTRRRPAFAPIYKAEVHYVPSRQLYVVCGEHHGRQPVAAPALTQEAAIALARCLPAMRAAKHWSEDRWDERDRDTFRRLIEDGGLL